MEEEKKDVQPSMGDGDNGKEHENFCALCSKYTKDKLEPVQIGVIPIPPNGRMDVRVNVCPKCVGIINNAARLFREAAVKFKKQAEEALKKLTELQKNAPLLDGHGNKIGGESGSKISVPKLLLGKNFLKGLKGRKS